LVDTSEIKRKQRKRQWATRYTDRLSQSALEGQPYEDGQEHGSSIDIPLEGSNGKARRQPDGDLWRPDDERYYNPDKSSVPTSSGRWHYPANFDDVEPVDTGKREKKKKKDKKDRWERTQDAYSSTLEGNSGKKKKKKRKASEAASIAVEDDVNEFPEDAEGGLYRERPPQVPDKEENKSTEEQVFTHQF